MRFISRCCLGATVLVTSARASAAQPSAEALSAWNAVIARTEARIVARGWAAPSFDRAVVQNGGIDVTDLSTVDERGRTVNIAGATVQHWRGAMLIPGVTADALVDSLEHRPPRQPDVTASRILWRSNDRMAVSLRLVRRMVVSVTYDTEHVVAFSRLGAGRVFSRSVMTSVHEVTDPGTPRERGLTPEEEHGFLWKLQAYWWYEDTPAGVVVVMESLTLSRDIPAVVRPVASPLVRRIARESVVSALGGVRSRFP